MKSNNIENENVIEFLRKMEEELRKKIDIKENPRIIIHGGYGHNNVGDDALLLITREIILKIFPNAIIIAAGHNPKIVQKKYQDVLKDIIPVKFKSKEMLKEIFKCDAYIIAGGGLSHNYYHKNILKALFEPRGKFCHFILFLENLRRIPTILFFCGYHAIPDIVEQFLMKISLPYVTLLGVREKYSGEILETMKIKNYVVGYDPVLLYQSKESLDIREFMKKQGTQSSKYIMINFRNVIDYEITETAQNAIVEYIHLININFPDIYIIFVPYSVREGFCAENDLMAQHEILNKAKERYCVQNIIELKEYQTADQVKNLSKNAMFLLLARHHALVMAYEYDKPIIALSYDIKCRGFAEYAKIKHIIDYDKLNGKELFEITQKELKNGKASEE